MTFLRRVLCVPLLLSLSVRASEHGAYDCPDTPSDTHVWVTVKVKAAASCDKVKAEMLARVSGQWAKWTDPAMNGTYKLIDQTDADTKPRILTMSRDGIVMFTDKLRFVLQDSGSECEIQGCSITQVWSKKDYGTNYCNLFNMYCGTADGCCPVETDLTLSDETTQTSDGALIRKKICSGEEAGDGGPKGGSGAMGATKPVIPCNFGKSSEGNTLSSSLDKPGNAANGGNAANTSNGDGAVEVDSPASAAQAKAVISIAYFGFALLFSQQADAY